MLDEHDYFITINERITMGKLEVFERALKKVKIAYTIEKSTRSGYPDNPGVHEYEYIKIKLNGLTFILDEDGTWTWRDKE